jgi:hypothetical protein
MSDLSKFPLFYVEIKDDRPERSLLSDDEDECSAGGEHEPETEHDELTTSFWGNIQTTKFSITSCSKCGEICRPNHNEGNDDD